MRGERVSESASKTGISVDPGLAVGRQQVGKERGKGRKMPTATRRESSEIDLGSWGKVEFHSERAGPIAEQRKLAAKA